MRKHAIVLVDVERDQSMDGILADHNRQSSDRSSGMSVDDRRTSPAAEAISRIVELLLSSRLIHFTACDRKLTFEFLDRTESGKSTQRNLAISESCKSRMSFYAPQLFAKHNYPSQNVSMAMLGKAAG